MTGIEITDASGNARQEVRRVRCLRDGRWRFYPPITMKAGETLRFLDLPIGDSRVTALLPFDAVLVKP